MLENKKNEITILILILVSYFFISKETMQSVPIKQLDSENMKRKNYQINRINSSSSDKQKKNLKKYIFHITMKNLGILKKIEKLLN